MATKRSFVSMLNEKKFGRVIKKEDKAKINSKSLFALDDDEFTKSDNPSQILGGN